MNRENINSDSHIITGVDMVEIGRIRSVWKKWGNRFINRIFTQREMDCAPCKPGKPGYFSYLAGRFASKEALIKILKSSESPPMNSIEILKGKNGEPVVNFLGESMRFAGEHNIRQVSLSISHCRNYAVSFAVAVISPHVQ